MRLCASTRFHATNQSSFRLPFTILQDLISTHRSNYVFLTGHLLCCRLFHGGVCSFFFYPNNRINSITFDLFLRKSRFQLQFSLFQAIISIWTQVCNFIENVLVFVAFKSINTTYWPFWNIPNFCMSIECREWLSSHGTLKLVIGSW